jgi:hypothetical protein
MWRKHDEDWSDGILEYWSNGFRSTQHSITPTLQYSKEVVLWLRQWVFTPTRQFVSAAKPARSLARNGTSFPAPTAASTL